MRQAAVLLVALFRVLPLAAQEHAPDVPRENAAKHNWDTWIPEGWVLLRSTTGDLNSDGEDDAVLVLEKSESKSNSQKQQGLGTESDRRYGARRLLVLVRDESEFRVGVQTEKFLPSQNIKNDQCSMSSVTGIEIRRNKFFLTLAHEFACGTGAGGGTKFKFQMRENRLRLIGVDATYSTRDDSRTSSRNYLTGKVVATFSKVEGDDPETCTAFNKKLKQRHVYLDGIGSAASYEIHGEPWSNACKQM